MKCRRQYDEDIKTYTLLVAWRFHVTLVTPRCFNIYVSRGSKTTHN